MVIMLFIVGKPHTIVLLMTHASMLGGKMRSSDHIRVFGTRLSCQLHAWDRPCHFPTRTRVLNIMQCVVIFQTTCKMETLQVKDKCKVHLCHCCACVHGYVAWSNAN